MTDASAFAAYRMDPEVARYQAWDDYDLQRAEEFCTAMAECQPGVAGSWFQFALTDIETGVLLGDVGVRSGEPGEVGFTLARENWGKGLAREGVGAVLEYMRSEHGLRTVHAHVHPDNDRSKALLTSLGFDPTGEHEGDVRFVRSLG